MTEKQGRRVAGVYRLALAGLACLGLYDTMFTASGGFMGASSLAYYTIQSNLWALLLALAGLLLLWRGRGEPDWFHTLRFVVAVAIMVTFLVFWTMLAPTMERSYLKSASNLTLHTLVPLLTLGDALLFDGGHVPKKKHLLYCAIPPLWYLGFAMVRAQVKTFPTGSRYPYWFLDVDKLGWFGLRDGVGVFYWVLVVVAIVLGLGALLRLAKGACVKKRGTRKENV